MCFPTKWLVTTEYIAEISWKLVLYHGYCKDKRIIFLRYNTSSFGTRWKNSCVWNSNSCQLLVDFIFSTWNWILYLCISVIEIIFMRSDVVSNYFPLLWLELSNKQKDKKQNRLLIILFIRSKNTLHNV